MQRGKKGNEDYSEGYRNLMEVEVNANEYLNLKEIKKEKKGKKIMNQRGDNFEEKDMTRITEITDRFTKMKE